MEELVESLWHVVYIFVSADATLALANYLCLKMTLEAMDHIPLVAKNVHKN